MASGQPEEDLGPTPPPSQSEPRVTRSGRKKHKAQPQPQSQPQLTTTPAPPSATDTDLDPPLPLPPAKKQRCLWEDIESSEVAAQLREKSLGGVKRVGVLAVGPGLDTEEEVGSFTYLNISNRITGRETKNAYEYAGVKASDKGLKDQVDIASSILHERADLFASLFPHCQADDFREPRTFTLAYGPCFIMMSGASGGAAILVGLFASRAGADVREKMAFVGRLSHCGEIIEVDHLSLFLKLHAVHRMGPDFKVVIPRKHHGYVMRNKGDHDWLIDMIDNDRIYFVDNVLELLEHAIKGLAKGCLTPYKDKLDEGVAMALAKAKVREDGELQSGWVELVTITPGSGQIRSACDTDGFLCSCLLRSRILAKQIIPRMFEEVKKWLMVTVEELDGVDFLLHHSSQVVQNGMELATFICLLQILFQLHGKPTDMFLGYVDEATGTFRYGVNTIPELSRRDVHAVRKAGITRLFIGKPATTISSGEGEETAGAGGAKVSVLPPEARYRLMAEAAVEDLGPEVAPLEIIVLTNHNQLMAHLDPNAPQSIFSGRPLKSRWLMDNATESMVVDTETPRPMDGKGGEGGDVHVEQQVQAKPPTQPPVQGLWGYFTHVASMFQGIWRQETG